MKTRNVLPLILAIILVISVTLTVPPVSTASPALSVSTDKAAYARGENVVITVTGTPGTVVGVEVYNPYGATEFVDQGTIGADGTFTTTFTLKADASVGRWIVNASGGGETATTQFDVKYTSTISISLDKTFIVLGESVTVSGVITTTDIPSPTTVYIEYSTNGGATWNTAGTATATDGSYSFTWTPGVSGTLKVRARWPGGAVHFGATSPALTLTVSPKARSTLTISVSPTVINFGETVTVTGTLTPALAGVQITLTYTRPDGAVVNRTVTTDASGSFTDTFKPDMDGVWKVKARWPGNVNYVSAVSDEVSFKVKTPIVLTLEVQPKYASLNQSILFVCRFSPPLTGVSIVLKYSSDGGATWNVLTTMVTGAGGYAAYVWTPPSEGEYQFWAVFQGTADLMPASSDVVKVTVQKVVKTPEQLAKELEQTKKTLQQTKQELEQTKTTLSEKEEQLASTESQLQQAQQKLSQAESKLESTERMLQDTMQALSACRAMSTMYVIVGIILGFILGFLVAYFLTRRRR